MKQTWSRVMNHLLYCYCCCCLLSCLFPHLGNRVKESSYGNHWQWFNNLQASYSMSRRLCPQQCRHMFVGERMGEGAVSGPSAQAAAIVMGNSQERELQGVKLKASAYSIMCSTIRTRSLVVTLTTTGHCCLAFGSLTACS